MSIKKTAAQMWHKFRYSLKVMWKHLGRVPHRKTHILLGFLAFCLFIGGLGAIWLSTLTIPNLDSFSTRRIAQSTKIYDSTSNVLLYDLNQGTKRTLVASNQISDNMKKSVVSIEDAGFYSNNGIEPVAILRAVVANVTARGIAQGGSTITQQLVKNALLTSDQSITRKLKEWVLALKVEKIMSKDQILTLYLNEIPFGGQIYGVEEASEEYYGKHASEISVAQAAYLAAMIQAPTHYSPYGANRGELNSRQKLVLKKMSEQKMITADEYQGALAENVQFKPQETSGIKAPHFVNFVIDKLHDYYDDSELANGGFRIITTLNYDLESKGEALTKQYALQNEKTYKAKNAALVAIDPQTGNILAMVGSRDYFDNQIDGNFNITTAYRQPGSTFKPIVYATAFEKGYEPETVVFDTPTEFSTNCPPETALLAEFPTSSAPQAANAGSCYHPVDFDGLFLGPIDLRHALAQSRNIPAIKMLYLAGISDSLKTASDLGITSLNTANDYGLTLVLGGGEVSPLELTSAYGTFANDGIHMPYKSILKIEDKDGNVLKDFTNDNTGLQALPKQVALKIADVLSDYPAKDPNEFLHFPDQDVAAKTGTTNNYRDAWIMGFTPNLAVGVWAGNNDNTPMDKKVAGYVAAPLWSAFMHQAIAELPVESFEKPAPEDLSSLKPILRGGWQGGSSYTIDKITGNLATQFTPPEDRVEKFTGGGIHDILQYVNKDDPLGPAPANPANDPQYARWEFGVQEWLKQNPQAAAEASAFAPQQTDTVHVPGNSPTVSIVSPNSSVMYEPSDRITIQISHSEKFPLAKVDYYTNGNYLGESDQSPFALSFVPKDLQNIQAANTLRAVATDNVGNTGESSVQFSVDMTGGN